MSDKDIPKSHITLNSASGYYYVDLYWTTKPKRKRISTKSKDRAAAEKYWEEKKDNLLPIFIKTHEKKRLEIESRNAIQTSKEPTISKLVDWYLDIYLPSKDGAENTIQNCKRVLDCLVVWSGSKNLQFISQLNMGVIQEFVADYYGDLLTSTRRLKLTILRAWINAAYKSEKIDEIPVRTWDFPKLKQKRTPKALKSEEIETILSILKSKRFEIYHIVAFIAYTGVRVSDACDLRWSNINWEDNYIEKTLIKTKNDWKFPIIEQLRDILTEVMPENTNIENHVFLDDGKPFREDSIYYKIKSTLKKEGFNKPVTTKTFRISFATIGANQGVPPKVLQKCLGHTDIKTTLRFYTEADMSSISHWTKTIFPVKPKKSVSVLSLHDKLK